MALSPFRRHQMHVNALISGTIVAATTTAAPEEPAPDTPQGQEYAALRVLLHENLRQLQDIASHEARVPKKREFAAAFAPWIEGVLEAGEAGQAAQDEILLVNMIWAIDYRVIDYALKIGAHAVRHNLVMPAPFTRTVACFLAEDIATVALATAEAVTHAQLLALLDLVTGRDMPDPVMAKLHKAIGRSFRAMADAFDPTADSAPSGGKAAYLSAAIEHFTRALALDKNAGVKKDIERAQTELKKAAPSDPDQAPPE